MEWAEIISAAIAAIGAVFGSAIIQSKTTAILQTKLEALKEDLARLSDRVNKHNNLIDRMTKAECKIEELEKRGEK